MAGIFDFLLGESSGEKARREAREASQALAERKFAFEQEQASGKQRQSQIERLEKSLASSDLSQEGKRIIGQRLTALQPELASELPQPQLPQPPGREESPSLFNFTQPKRQVTGDFREGTVTSKDPLTGETKVLQQPLAPKSARELTFEGLSPAEQEAIVKKGPGSTVSVSVGAGEEAVTKTVRSKIQDEVRKIDDRIIQLDEIDSGFEDQFLTVPGKLRTGFAEVLQKYAEVPPAKTEKFLEKIGLVDKADVDLVERKAAFMLPAYTILNETIKEITGAAVREGEEGRLGASTVDPTRDVPAVFRAKSKAVRKILIRQRKERAILLQRGLEYNKENVESIPEGNVDAIWKTEILGQALSTQEKLQSSVNIVKEADANGKATVSNAPSQQTQPQTLQDKLQFDDISKLLPKGKASPFFTSHPKSIKMIQILLAEEKMETSDIEPFLDKIKGMADEDVVRAIARGRK